MRKSFCITLFIAIAAALAGQTPRLVVPFGHLGKITFVNFMPGGKTIRTGDGSGKGIYWDLLGHELEYSSGEMGIGFFPAFGLHSPDNTTILQINSSWDTVRLMDNASGRRLHTFTAQGLPVKAWCFSLDGRTVLTGTADGVWQWDVLTGRLLNNIKVGDGPVTSMDFSPDGNLVLTADHDGSAKLWDLSGRLLHTFTGNSARVDRVLDVTFSPDGKTVMAGGMQGARLWNLTGQGTRTFSGHTGLVRAVAFSPDGKTVLTGSQDNTARLWDVLSGRLLHTLKGHADRVFDAAFSPDGKTVLTGSQDSTAKLWEVLSGRLLRTLEGHNGAVKSVSFAPDGRTVLTGSEDESVKLWDVAGTLLETFAGWGELAAFSPDGKSVLTGYKEESPILRDLSGGAFQDLGRDVGLSDKHYDFGGIQGLIFSPDGKSVLTMSDKAKLWDVTGGLLGTIEGNSGYDNSAAFSPDGRIVVTGSSDNTLKIWDIAEDAASITHIATLIAIDSADWVVTTPSGLFDASSAAMRLMYFVVSKDLDVIELDQLKERYYEPGLLAKVMGFSDEPLREAGGFDSVALYPVVRLQLDTLQNKLHIRLTARNGGIGKVSVFINGKEVVEDANKVRIMGAERIRDTAMTIHLEQYARYFLIDTLNTISIRAYNATGWLKSAPHSLNFWSVPIRAKGSGQKSGAASTRLNRAPALYVVAVGTADYAGTELDLNYSGKDAIDVAGALGQIGAKLFGPDSVFVYLFTTDTTDMNMQPSKTNIKAAFDLIKSRSKAEDMLVVYLSGHGVAYNALFYYLTMEARSFNLDEDADAGVLGKRTVSSNELTRWINDIPAQKQVLIIDACNSGKVVEILAGGKKAPSASQVRALDRMKDRTGMFVLTGSAADMVSYEAGQYSQSLLTYSLLEGMSGLAPLPEQRVEVGALFEYARNRVPELAAGIGGVQTPMLLSPTGGSFPIGLKTDQVQIALKPAKPVFIRNVFLDAERYDDHLGLSEAMDQYFREQTIKGAQAELVYVDVPEYENGFSVKGLYSLSGDALTVRGRFFKGKNPVEEPFQVTGKATELDVLVEAILEQCGVCFK